MMPALRFLLVLVVFGLGYAAYRQDSSFVGRSTGDSIDAIVQMADGFNASLSREDILEKATTNGELDVSKLRQLLTPAARRAGELVKLERELKELAGGPSPRSPEPTPAARAPVVPPARTPSVPAPPPENRERTWSLSPFAPPADWEEVVEASQTSWRVLFAVPLTGNFTVLVRGTVQAATPPGDEDLPQPSSYRPGLRLLVPEAGRFTPLGRVCQGESCQPIRVATRHGGVEWQIDFCAFETAPFDRIEVWYNDYYRDNSTNERVDLATTYGTNSGSYQMRLARYSDGSCRMRRWQTLEN